MTIKGSGYWRTFFTSTLFLAFILSYSPTKAQEKEQETFPEVLDEEINSEALEEVRKVKFELNEIKGEELRQLYILDHKQILAFLKYRNTYGPIVDIHELQLIPTFELSSIRKLLSYVYLSKKSISKSQMRLRDRLKQTENHYLLLQYERNSNGKQENSYLGSADKLSLRFKISHNKKFSFALNAEKDAGELFSWSPQVKRWGFDYYGGHISLENKGIFKRILIGDFLIQSGQGLVLGASFLPAKSSDPISFIKKSHSLIKPKASMMESDFFRGLAASLERGNFTFTPFYSRAYKDANIENNEITSRKEVSSINISGLHRSLSELEKRKQLLEQNLGLIADFKTRNQNLQTGLSLIGTKFGFPFHKNETPYRKFKFYSDQNLTAGSFINFYWENFTFFGEGAISSSGGKAILGGLIGQLSTKWTLSLIYRNYNKNFHSFYGIAFGEQSEINNEKGVYLGLKYKRSKKLSLSFFADRFQFPWLRYQVDAPSQGYEIQSKVDYRFSKGTSLAIRFQFKERETNSSIIHQSTNSLSPEQRKQMQIHFSHKLSEVFSVQSRLVMNHYQKDGAKSKGFALIQDLIYQGNRIKLKGRVALFDTENYKNRIYLYEHELPHSFSFPLYYGKGLKSYLLLYFKVIHKINISLKYSYNYTFSSTSTTDNSNIIIDKNFSILKAQIKYNIF